LPNADEGRHTVIERWKLEMMAKARTEQTRKDEKLLLILELLDIAGDDSAVTFPPGIVVR